MPNLKSLTADELDSRRLDVLKEIERRDRLEAIPAEIAALKDQFTAAGGNLADLNTGA